MSRQITSAMLWGIVGYLVCYLSAYLLGLPLLRYLPVMQSWTFAPPDGAISMGYFGLLLYGVAGGLMAFFAALALPERLAIATIRRSVWAIVIVAGFGLMAALLKEGLHWFF
jgi:hypothetical protein